MAYNSLTINQFAVNTIGGKRRQAIIENLLELYAAGANANQVGRANIRNNAPIRPLIDRDEEPVDLSKIEQPSMRIDIEIMGQQFGQTIDRNINFPIVTISNVAIFNDIKEYVNIFDVKTKAL